MTIAAIGFDILSKIGHNVVWYKWITFKNIQNNVKNQRNVRQTSNENTFLQSIQ